MLIVKGKQEEEMFGVEFYKKDDSLFMLFSERVAWFEAFSICKTYEAHLCILNSTAKANFVAYFLSDSLHHRKPLFSSVIINVSKLTINFRL